MTAEIVSVGTELLLGQIVDTHAPSMGRLLAETGISCTRRSTVGDNLHRIAAALRESMERVDLVVTIGGLGPTQDDLTRDAIAEALGDVLVHEPSIEARLRERFESRRVPWADSIARQAWRPACARLVENQVGTAPGLICEKGGKRIVALPGPSSEFEPMARGPVREYLTGLGSGQVIHSRVLRVCGMGESAVEEAIGDLTPSENPTVAPYAHTGEVHLRLTARAPSAEEAERLIAPLATLIRERLGDAVYGTGEISLEQAVIDRFRQRGWSLAVAESLTGGGLGERLTSVAGSSEVFRGGVIAYSSEVKKDLLGVSTQTLAVYGAVSAECAREMAAGAREQLGAAWAASLTGNAGPATDSGGSVGQVFLGLANSEGARAVEATFSGSRQDVRSRSIQLALTELWRAARPPSS